MEKRGAQIVFRGIVIDVEQVEVLVGNHGWHTYQIVRHPGGAAVLPLHEDGTVTLIRQFRPAINAATLELPAGRLEPGEDPAVCGLRELREETGLNAAALQSLGVYYSSPGVFNEVNHLFLATSLTQGLSTPEAYEEVETVRISLEEALAMARDGRISDGKTMAALMRAEGLPS